MEPLTKEQVHKYMSILSEEQREFLLNHAKQSKKSKWLEVLARNKGINIQANTTEEELEALIDDWVLVEIKDSGFGNKDYKCMCGTPLRYQYVIYHKKKEETVGLGIKCFENHTNLSMDVVRDIKKEFYRIDLERDEILQKVIYSQFFDIEPFLYIETIPSEIMEQAKVKLPLTDKQIAHLERLKESYDLKIGIEKAYQFLKPQAREFIDLLPSQIKDKLLTNIVNGVNTRVVLPDGFRDAEIEQLQSLGLPLLDRQMERIFAYKEQLRLKRIAERNREQEELFQSIRQNYARPIRIETTDKTIDYETLKERHLDTLKRVREKENTLSRGMQNDWTKVQDMVRQCKKGESFDYESFKLNLTMICMSLRVERDSYL